MTRLIDKDALVAEIEKRKELVPDPLLSGNDLMTGERNAYFNLLSFINTLEVKKVDLEKEYEEFFVDDPIFGNFITNDTMGMKLAKHFFELGMAVSNKEQKGGEI